MNQVTLKVVDENDIKFLVKWWNDGEVTSSMGFPNGMHVTEISLSNRFKHQFNNTDTIDSKIFLIMYNNKPVGDLQYGQLDLNDKSCRLAIKIGESEVRGKGIAKKALNLIIEDLQNTYELTRINIDVFPENKPAYHLYKRLGFETIETLNDVWTDETGQSHDLLMMTKSL